MARAVPTSTQLASAAPIFTALGDETRLRLVTRMCHEGPLSITSLADGTTLSRQAVTKHLRMLSEAGLARPERVGREQRWQIEAKRLAEVRRLLAQIGDQWDESLRRLRTFLDDDRS
ncbi:MAG: metalloregulator ArsR/SmtB family transcription factor [Vicinamibacterales bacterium]